MNELAPRCHWNSIRRKSLARLSWRLFFLGILTVGLSIVGSSGDEPLAGPSRQSVESRSGEFVAISDPEEGTSIRSVDSPKNVLWSIPEWFRVLFMANDGDHLVTGYDGMNLIPLANPESVEVLVFWFRGERIESFVAGDLIDREEMQRTVSHFHWGSYLGFDEEGSFRVELANGDVLAFSIEDDVVVVDRDRTDE